MSTTYAGTATYPATITLPDDSDPRDAASVNAPLEGLADRTAYLASRFSTVDVYDDNTGTTVGNTSSHTYVDSSAIVTLTGRTVGEKIRITVCFLLITNDATGTDRAWARLVCTENGGSAIVLSLERQSPLMGAGGDTYAQFVGTVVRTIATSGTFVAKVQVKAEGTHTSVLEGPGQLIAQLM